MPIIAGDRIEHASYGIGMSLFLVILSAIVSAISTVHYELVRICKIISYFHTLKTLPGACAELLKILFAHIKSVNSKYISEDTCS